MKSTGAVRVEIQNSIATVTIDRPEALNALNEALFHELDRVFESLDKDPQVRAVILTGSGKKAFSCGADISMVYGTGGGSGADMVRQHQDIFWRIEHVSKPVIAAINGYAFGGGCELSLLCDIRVASESAVFSFPEVSLGLIPGSGGTQRLTRLIGPGRAKYMIYTAARVSAQEAERFGLVDLVVPQEQLLARCREIAEKICRAPSASIALAKKAIDFSVVSTLYSCLEEESRLFCEARATDECEMRLKAFLERRNSHQ